MDRHRDRVDEKTMESRFIVVYCISDVWSWVIWSNHLYDQFSLGPKWGPILIRLIGYEFYQGQFWLDKTGDHISDMHCTHLSYMLHTYVIGLYRKFKRKKIKYFAN